MSSVLTNFRSAFDSRFFRLSVGNLTLLTFVWLLVGFAMGTALLLGPVRWVAAALEGHPSQELLERSAVVAIILFLIVVSHWISLVIVRALVRMRPRNRPLLLLVPIAAATGAYLLWVNPVALSGFMGEEHQISSQFTFGPYPDLEKMIQLREEGYSGIISLLHPAVVPFEPQLIGRGKRDAEEAEIRFIHIPMLPWVSGNEAAAERIQEIAREGRGRYYVHCYLGKDRVQLFQRLVEQVPNVKVERFGQQRRIANRQLVRGETVEVAEGVYLIPFPVPDEFEYLIIYNGVQNVVALLDPESEGDRKRIEEERQILEPAAVPYTVVPISSRNYTTAKILETVALVRDMDKPVVVHSFHSVMSGKAPMSEAFLQAYRSGKAPLPPALFERQMANGRPRVIAPGIAVGPRPTEAEISNHLAAHGVRTMIYAGPAGDAPKDEAYAARFERLDWVAMQGNPESWYDFLEQNGPVYLYGPEAEAAAIMIERDLGPALPGLPADS